MTDYSILSDPEMGEILESFVVETHEILENLDLDLVELEKRSEDSELLNKIFRSFHTIKGTAGFLGLVKLQKLTHRCEDILNRLRKNEIIVNDEIMDTIFCSYDTIKELMIVIETNKNEDYEIEEVIDRLEKIIESAKVDCKKSVTDSEQLINIESQSGNENKDLQIKSSEIEPTNLEIENSSAASNQIINQEKSTSSKSGDNYIRVEVERLDNLLNLVSELVLSRNRLDQITAEMIKHTKGSELSNDLAETTRQIDLMTTELQLAVMKTRMIKIGKVFSKFSRLVRDLSKESGKEVQLIIYGEDTELDKTLIEEMNDPLVHLVRNSIDHGLELPGERAKAGKNRKGTIILSAEQEGNNIVITIKDDGKGINADAIKQKALEGGLITQEAAKELSEQEAFNLIFLPGFSTAKQVTNISGRGVGMDVVKTNITRCRGIITVKSEVGHGTEIIIKLPLTLAIIQGLLVEILGETIVIPLNSVLEVIRIPKDQIYFINNNMCIKLRDSVLPLLDVGNLLFSANKREDQSNWQHIVVAGIAEKRIGLKVDNLVGQKEIVIKSLGNYLGNINGIAGSSILGDGKVVMIIDIAELVNKYSGKN